MSWGDNWPYPDSADRNGDGKVDFNERAEYDYMYDSIMGTNMSGFCPENDIDPDYDEDDDDDFFADDSSDYDFDEEDEDEKADSYSMDLGLEYITRVDYDGYFTADGEYHFWKIKDMLDEYDEDGFWDKCGNYHEFEPEPDGYWEANVFHPFHEEDEKTCFNNKNECYPSAFGYWIDGICYLEHKTKSDLVGAIMNGKYYPYFLLGNRAKNKGKPGKDLSDRIHSYDVTKAAENIEKSRNGYPHYWGFIGYWDGNRAYIFEKENPDHIIGFVENDTFTPYEKYNCGFVLACDLSEVYESNNCYDKYFSDIDYSKTIDAKGRWIDNTCFIYGRKNHDDYIGAYCNGEFFPYTVRGDWREPDPPGLQDELSKEELYKKVSGLVNSKFADKMEMYIKGTSAYEGKIGFWYDDILYFADFDDKYIGVITKDEFIPLEEYYNKQQAESNSDDETFEFNEDNLIEDIDSFFSESSKTVEPEITFSDTSAGKIYSFAYENVDGIKDFLSPEEFESDYTSLIKVYSKSRITAAECWSWVLENHYESILNDSELEGMLRDFFYRIPSEMFITDNEDRNKFLQHYIAERPELLEILFSKCPYDKDNAVPFQFLGWSIVRNDFVSFEKVYNMLLDNQNWVFLPPKKECVLEHALFWRNEFARSSSSEKFYIFFKDEITSIEHEGKKQHLSDMLNQKVRGEYVFVKPKNHQNSTANPALKQVSNESQKVSSDNSKPASDNSVLKDLLERKRVLESMLKEVNDKIAKFDAPTIQHKTTPKKENDVFFDEAGVAGMKYGDPEAVYDVRPNAKLNLVREPENQHDKNAVTVTDQYNRRLGYITRQTNIPIARAIDEGAELYAKVVTLPLYEKYPNMKIEIWESK